MKDFFISYTKADRDWAEWIAWQLEEAKYTVVIQAWDFGAGCNFALEMQKATIECQKTIAVLSPRYLAAEFPQPEWAAAFAQDPTGEKRKLIPVRVRECKPEGLLAAISHIDLVGLDDEDGAKQKLLAGIKEGRAKPTTRPKLPSGTERTITEKPPFPSPGKGIWNVPLSRNPNFTGRKEHFKQLEKALASGHKAALTQAMHGLGGVGKTQIALEYAYRFRNEYDIIWWIRAEEPAKLASDYAALATQLNLSEKDAKDQRATVKAVRDYLEQTSKWLIVFDNATGPDGVREYLPQGSTGQVIITSRNPNWRDIVQESLEVCELPRTKSVEFLEKRTGQKDKKAADTLADALGDLPLALEQAGAYICETGISLATYLELFKKEHEELLARGKPLNYSDTVATTWEITAGKLPAVAIDLLNLCAFFAPDDIPLEIMKQGAEFLPHSLATTVRNELKFNDAIAALRRYSLITGDEHLISIHRLVQAVTRDRFEMDQKKQWAQAAVNIVNNVFPFESNDVRTWNVCAMLLPHAVASVDHADAHAVAPEETARLLNLVGLYLSGRAEFTEAKKCHEHALRIAEMAYDPTHPNVAVCVNNLGRVLQNMGDLKGSKKCCERALRIDEKAYGSNHPAVATHVNNLGLVLKDMGDLKGAKECFERALKIDEKILGPNHPEVAIYINNLGSVLQDMDDLKGAKECYERALKIGEETLGPNHPNVATCVNNLGSVFQEMDDLKGAKEYYERALKIDEKAYGPNHPDVARDVNNLGGVLKAMSDPKGAKECCERALKIDEKAYGFNHPEVGTDVNNLGGVLQDMGDLKGAKECYARALSIFEQFLGKAHPKTVVVRGNLERVIAEMKRKGLEG